MFVDFEKVINVAIFKIWPSTLIKGWFTKAK